jgi:hypothetical protein
VTNSSKQIDVVRASDLTGRRRRPVGPKTRSCAVNCCFVFRLDRRGCSSRTRSVSMPSVLNAFIFGTRRSSIQQQLRSSQAIAQVPSPTGHHIDASQHAKRTSTQVCRTSQSLKPARRHGARTCCGTNALIAVASWWGDAALPWHLGLSASGARLPTGLGGTRGSERA